MKQGHKFRDLCRQKIAEYYNQRFDKTEHAHITEDDVHLVWYCKTLQNHKALLTTMIPDGMYFEMTYNGDKDELYLDAYKKWENVCIPNASVIPTQVAK